jgi:hypothetical protein
LALLSQIAVMMRAGSRALRTMTAASGLARLKYGPTNSSRRPFGAHHRDGALGRETRE